MDVGRQCDEACVAEQFCSAISIFDLNSSHVRSEYLLRPASHECEPALCAATNARPSSHAA